MEYYRYLEKSENDQFRFVNCKLKYCCRKLRYYC